MKRSGERAARLLKMSTPICSGPSFFVSYEKCRRSSGSRDFVRSRKATATRNDSSHSLAELCRQEINKCLREISCFSQRRSVAGQQGIAPSEILICWQLFLVYSSLKRLRLAIAAQRSAPRVKKHETTAPLLEWATVSLLFFSKHFRTETNRIR